ncbi:hypothetical protein WN943_027657 [Citrus x changshan-huyou]
MGWSKWSCQFFFLQLLILLPLSLELELQLIGEDSSCQCPRYQPDYPNLPVDQCYHLIQSSFVQDRGKVLAEIQARIKKELIAELQARIKKELIAIQPTLQHLREMIDYFLPANDNNGGYIGPHLDPD